MDNNNRPDNEKDYTQVSARITYHANRYYTAETAREVINDWRDDVLAARCKIFTLKQLADKWKYFVGIPDLVIYGLPQDLTLTDKLDIDKKMIGELLPGGSRSPGWTYREVWEAYPIRIKAEVV